MSTEVSQSKKIMGRLGLIGLGIFLVLYILGIGVARESFSTLQFYILMGLGFGALGWLVYAFRSTFRKAGHT